MARISWSVARPPGSGVLSVAFQEIRTRTVGPTERGPPPAAPAPAPAADPAESVDLAALERDAQASAVIFQSIPAVESRLEPHIPPPADWGTFTVQNPDPTEAAREAVRRSRLHAIGATWGAYRAFLERRGLRDAVLEDICGFVPSADGAARTESFLSIPEYTDRVEEVAREKRLKFPEGEVVFEAVRVILWIRLSGEYPYKKFKFDASELAI
jgi:hypothetical protein